MIKILHQQEKVSDGKIYCDLCGFRIPKGQAYIESINIDSQLLTGRAGELVTKH